MTSWPFLVSASPTIFRMKTASSTTSTRAMSAGSFRWRGSVGGREDLLEADGPLVLLDGDEPAHGDARPVDVDVDGVLGAAVELDDHAVGQRRGLGRAQARAAELGPHAQRHVAQRLAHGVGA